ncbi:MAG: DNA methyltransferase [Candidatus Methanofastidiosa archaeon]|jgi:hypothetical protein|nr:adenine-specific methyltransferase EcoRI family protein [Acholeplasmataceae bacterium]NMA30521.1 DNA methyltransferase [Candidatus Methanofastidiosa archaeon]
MGNKNLSKAKKRKNDEFYTQYSDIQKEIQAYLEHNSDVFRDQVVYCNCDDPFESNFFQYFALNFNKLRLRQLITTSYKPSPVANTQLQLFGNDKTLVKAKVRSKITANKFIINEVEDINKDGEFNLKDVAIQLKRNKQNEWAPLKGNGDFHSSEAIELLKQADIVVTNPPFSLFREYVAQLIEYEKKFLIIGNMNAITYKEIFPLLKENKVWLGVNNGPKIYEAPRAFNQKNTFIDKDGKRYAKMGNTGWFTNLDHGRRHKPLPLMTMIENIKFNKKLKGQKYQKYDNYNAIEVPFTGAIPSDYDGVMGVPITFLDKYSPEQFEILGSDYNIKEGLLPELINLKWSGKIDRGYVNNKRLYTRIFIKHKRI